MGVAEVVDHNVQCGEEGVHIEHKSSVPFPWGSGSKPTLVCGHLPLKLRGITHTKRLRDGGDQASYGGSDTFWGRRAFRMASRVCGHTPAYARGRRACRLRDRRGGRWLRTRVVLAQYESSWRFMARDPRGCPGTGTYRIRCPA